MTAMNKGPDSLNPSITRELEQASPAWARIQGQTKEYLRHAEFVGKNDPPKGEKESWTKLTAALATTAASLDKAAQAKDKDAALAAQKELKESCDACHKVHRPPPPPGYGSGGAPKGPKMGGPGGGK
jgi:mono/diheme cytochrome c family protein